ncbi:RNA methyltransferase [Clostridia bacterium]|nr:RNA methyltransferase [Clostridia bacterium]
MQTLKTNRLKRRHEGVFIVEGVRNINQAVECGWHISGWIYSRDRRLSGWASEMIGSVQTDRDYVLDGQLMTELSGKDETSELLALVSLRSDESDPAALEGQSLVLLFDRPSNHGNLGSLMRSCDAFGVTSLIITGHAVDVYDPDVIAASMGSFFRAHCMRAERMEDVESIIAYLRDKQPGFQVVGTTAKRETPIDRVDFTRPTLLMIGNETDGLARGLKERCDILATIPMAATSSASSLNVACAATVMLYEAVRQKGG